jgi:hypothetical protein
VVELGHVTILPQSESEVQFRIEFLRKLILGIKALQEDLDLLNAEMIKELRNDYCRYLGEPQLDCAFGVTLLELLP